MGGGQVDHGGWVMGWVSVGGVGGVGGGGWWDGGVVGPHDTPHHAGGHQMPPMFFLTIW